MLDAYIIDRIRREQEQIRQIDTRVPLQIEHPRPRIPGPPEGVPAPPEDPSPNEERGTILIDYTL